MSVVAVIQARVRSIRLPGKVLADVAGEPLLGRVVARVERMKLVDRIVVAIGRHPADDPIGKLCAAHGWTCFRGSEEDVLDRYHAAAAREGARQVVRVTADDPLLCPREGDRVVARHWETGSDYTHNLSVWGSGMPVGAGCEVFAFSALEESWRDGREPHHREHVDEYVYEHPERFRIERVDAPPELRRPELRLTVDTPEDLEFVREVYRRLARPGARVELEEVLRLLDLAPELTRMNGHVLQKRV
jgi:spore coat polysaccharide biosynthesis protein SpsF (cytidylyltransferase family)